MPPTTTSLKLPEELKERLTEVAHKVAQTPHAYMVEAIAEKVERDEKRQAFYKAGRESFARFKATGIAYRAEDVREYILKLAAGKKVRRPKPIRIPKSER